MLADYALTRAERWWGVQRYGGHRGMEGTEVWRAQRYGGHGGMEGKELKSASNVPRGNFSFSLFSIVFLSKAPFFYGKECTALCANIWVPLG